MKRNMEQMRLLPLQANAEDPAPDLSAFTQHQQGYHAALITEAGLAHGRITTVALLSGSYKVELAPTLDLS
jgi:hypothetical protein